MNANNIVVPRWQQGRCLAFRQSAWEWHVQMHNVATSEQEDDLEHTGQTYFSHSQRQPAHLNGAGAQARGTSRASSPWIHLKCYSCKGLQADVTSGPPDLGLVLCLQVFAFGELDDLLISAWLLATVLPVAGNYYLSLILAIFCTAPMVGETKTSQTWRPYRPSNNTA